MKNNVSEMACRLQCEPFCVVRFFSLIQEGATLLNGLPP